MLVPLAPLPPVQSLQTDIARVVGSSCPCPRVRCGSLRCPALCPRSGIELGILLRPVPATPESPSILLRAITADGRIDCDSNASYHTYTDDESQPGAEPADGQPGQAAGQRAARALVRATSNASVQSVRSESNPSIAMAAAYAM